MADNIVIKDGNNSSVTVASDDVSTVQFPRHKVVWGADGVANDTSATTPMPVNSVGNAAAGATDSGNPIKVGGVYRASAPTVSDGQRTDLLTDSHGNCQIAMATRLDTTNDAVNTRLISGTYGDASNNTLTIQTAIGQFNTTGDHSMVSGISGQTVRVIAYRIQAGSSAAATNTVKFTDTAGTPNTLSMTWDFNAREGATISAPPGSFEFKTGTSLGVQFNMSAAQPVSVMIQYVQN